QVFPLRGVGPPGSSSLRVPRRHDAPRRVLVLVNGRRHRREAVYVSIVHADPARRLCIKTDLEGRNTYWSIHLACDARPALGGPAIRTPVPRNLRARWPSEMDRLIQKRLIGGARPRRLVVPPT